MRWGSIGTAVVLAGLAVLPAAAGAAPQSPPRASRDRSWSESRRDQALRCR